ncbi:hypothetical protein PLICRDRAFT_151711 [Plicaturopsis crispa FD-325 SS-3]|nr:hypothetical protein PLICRDRAFT_151711 [Plicaturopsis crispa FD-325 SS-3]
MSNSDLTQFLDLPVELLPLIFRHILKSQHLASTCLVNKSFHTFATPLLYERAYIFAWHKNGKSKVIKLFRTLCKCPQLARYIRRLVIRDFPKALGFAYVDDTQSMCIEGIKNCVNLESCTWTRDGSLNTSILNALKQCSSLRDLEINGHSEGYYAASVLPQFVPLRKISLIMPSLAVIRSLPKWTKATGHTLKSLTLICKVSAIVTDELLESLAPHLTQLEHLYLAGCPKATDKGVWSIISANASGIVGLGLEGLSTKFDMAEFSRRCLRSGTLSHLRSITLTVQPHTAVGTWMRHVVDLLSKSPLEVFQIYSSGPTFEATLADEFWADIVSVHGQRLVRFSVHRLHINMAAIDDVCRRCTALEELFVVAEQSTLDALGTILSRAPKLRTIHINFPLEGGDPEDGPVLQADDALSLVRRCGPTITQFGCNSSVWKVERVPRVEQNGEIILEAKLAPYESPNVPEQFTVVRA